MHSNKKYACVAILVMKLNFTEYLELKLIKYVVAS